MISRRSFYQELSHRLSVLYPPMFKTFSRTDLTAIAICLDEEEQNTKKCRTMWVHDILKARKIEGEFFTLYKGLVDDETKFFQYFRMPKSIFYYILNKIAADVTKENTTFREAITPLEKLSVCLRLVKVLVGLYKKIVHSSNILIYLH